MLLPKVVYEKPKTMKTYTKKLAAIIFLLSTIIIVSCHKEIIVEHEGTAKSSVYTELTLSQEESDLVQLDNKFALKIFREIVSAEEDKNLFISPLSIAMALTMTYNGAGTTTKDAMQETLELSEMTIAQVNDGYLKLIDQLVTLDNKAKLLIANSIWYREGFSVKVPFINTNKDYFNAEVSALDFTDPSAKDVINGWVDENTNGKIAEIIKVIPPQMVMYLINAIYFKGIWTNEFDEDKTFNDLFTLPDNTQIPCRMMTEKEEYKYFENADFQAVNLTYGGGNFSMIILLPKPTKEVDDILHIMDIDGWDSWMSNFSEVEMALYLPKFKLDYEIGLKDILKSLGMDIAFSQSLADFSGISEGSENLYISEVKHKTFVEVNEEGTEAAAVTSVGIGITSLPPTMYINKPFIFAIRENSSETILFMGKIVEPTL